MKILCIFSRVEDASGIFGAESTRNNSDHSNTSNGSSRRRHVSFRVMFLSLFQALQNQINQSEYNPRL